MNEKKKRVRLADVAREANVSAATVSRYVRGKAAVNPQIKERIFQAANRLGFNLLSNRSSRVIAFLLSNRSVLHQFHAAVLSGAERYCAEHNYGLLFVQLQYSIPIATSEIELPDILQEKNAVAGVIVAGNNSMSLPEIFTRRGMPWVALGNNMFGDLEPAQKGLVFFDDIGGAYDLTRYLISLGHKDIAFVANRRLPWYARRFKSYERAMKEAGLSVRYSELNVREGECLSYMTTKLLLQENPAPTALFVGDDKLSIGVYRAIRDCGRTVPGDVSVAGFNDNPEASYLHPPLTTVNVFADEIGRQLAELLIKRIEGGDQPERPIVLPTQLVRRESCAPVTT